MLILSRCHARSERERISCTRVIPYPTGRFFRRRFPWHFAPGYDRSVPPGRAGRRFATASRERVSKTLQGKNISNRPYLRAIQPWAKFFSPFGWGNKTSSG